MTVASIVVQTAIAQEGKPYLYGGGGPNNYDCSGLTKYCYAAAGIILPHSSSLQYDDYPKVAVPQPADIVFFRGISGPPYPGHCGVCLTAPVNGIGQMIQAEETGTVVMQSSFSMLDSQWVGATRPVLPGPPPWPGIYLRWPPYTTGEAVFQWQREMDNRWQYHLSVDSTYGPLCAGACRDFQSKHKLVVDGIVGPKTWQAVFG